jgi:hypothetical protein
MARGNLYMAHRCGFTQKVLAGTLQAAGFGSVITMARPRVFDLWALATKSVCDEQMLRSLAGQHFPAP